MENAVTRVGNAQEIQYSVWNGKKLQTEGRTLEEIAEKPFVSSYYQLESSRDPLAEIMSTSSCLHGHHRHPLYLPDKARSPKKHPPTPVGGQGCNVSVLLGGQDYNINVTALPLASPHPALRSQRPQRPSTHNISILPLTFPPLAFRSQRPSKKLLFRSRTLLHLNQ
jgi:hypothetical protein